MDDATTRRFALTSLMLGNVTTGISVLAPAGMLIELSKGLSVTVYQAGLLITLGAMVLGVGSPLTAWLTSRFERRRLLGVTLGVLTATNLASALAPDYTSLLVIRLVMLAVGVIFTPQAVALVGMMVPPEKRAGGIAYAFLGWSLATAFGLPLVTILASAFGWRAAYGGIAVIAFASTVLLLWRLPSGLRGTPVVFSTWTALLRDPLIATLLVGTMVQIAGQFVIFAYMAPLLVRLAAATPAQIGLVFGLYGLGGFFGNIIATRLVVPWGAYRTSLLSTSCLCLGALIFALGAGAFAVMAAGVAVWGLGFASTNSMQQARLVGAAPAHAGASVSLNTSALYAGQAIGSAIGGALFAREMLGTISYIGAGLIGVGLLTVLMTRRFEGSSAP